MLPSVEPCFDSAMQLTCIFRLRYLVFICVSYFLYKFVRQVFLWPRWLSPLRKLPGPPVGNPFVGQLPAMLRGEPGIAYREWVKKYGPVMRVMGPFGSERITFTRPEALHKILVSDWIEYPRPAYLRNILGLITGYGLLTVTGNDHKQMRKAMNPAFSMPNLVAQTDMYYDSIEGLVDVLKKHIDAQDDPSKGKEFLMYEWMGKVTLDIICETAFGYKSDSLHNPHNELAEAYENLLGLQSGKNLAIIIAIVTIPGAARLIASGWAYNHRRWFEKIAFLAPAYTLIVSMHRIKKISSEMLAEKMADSAVAPSDTLAKRDIMSLLVRARNAENGDGYRMSEAAMMDQVLTFLSAGHETTASGLAWTLWLLANDLPAQTKLREEVSLFVADSPRPDYRTLKDMQWLDCVIMESLRVMPPVPGTARMATKSQYIDGVFVPKGTLVEIHIRVINTWKELWGDDAEDFRPDRWRNLPKSYNSTFSMLSFITGPHGCIGKTMAILEMKAVLALLIANFEFEPAYAGQKAQPTAAITMKPADGMPLRVKAVTPKQSV